MCCLAPGAAGGWADGCSSTTQLGAVRTPLKIAQTEGNYRYIYLSAICINNPVSCPVLSYEQVG